MVNKQGQTRLAQYYEYLTLEERRALEGEIVRKCLARNEQQVWINKFLPFFFLNWWHPILILGEKGTILLIYKDLLQR